MKFFSILLLFFTATAAAQSNHTVTMNGIGNIKLGMKKAEVEKITGCNLQINNLLKAEWSFDTILCSMNDLVLSLVFDRQYTDDKQYGIILRGVSSNSPAVKTPSGITIGDDKYKIISVYEAYSVWIVPDYEDDNTKRSKTKASIYLHGDDTGNVIIFRMLNNRIESIGVTWAEAYD